MEKDRNFAWSTCMNFVNREFLLENKLKFYEGILHEDVLFSYQLFISAKNACIRHIANMYIGKDHIQQQQLKNPLIIYILGSYKWCA